MSTSDVKTLTALAKACRKAGIKHYKCEGFEFSLTDEAPITKPRGKAAKAFHQDNGQVETSELSPEDLLFYSVVDPGQVSVIKGE